MSESHTPNALSPFSCKYSPQIPELLQKLSCSLAITTYQAGKLIFISARDENNLVQLPRTFNKPMGIDYRQGTGQLALADRDTVSLFSNAPALAEHYPRSPKTYDSLFLPRVTYHTGAMDIHDLSFGHDGLYAVNTLFSCLVKIDDRYNYRPIWKPPFVTKLVSEDRCHLNGMAMVNGRPKYATCFNQGNRFQSWRDTVTETGCVVDVETNEILFDDLAMPHSPRVYNNELYVLLSATGELVRLNVETGRKEVITTIQGFVRGMTYYKDHLFIATSKLRQNSSTFAKLDFAEKANEAAIHVLHLPTKAMVGKISYVNSVDEIYDLLVLPDTMRPNLLSTAIEEHKMAVTTPENDYWARSNG